MELKLNDHSNYESPFETWQLEAILAGVATPSQSDIINTKQTDCRPLHEVRARQIMAGLSGWLNENTKRR